MCDAQVTGKSPRIARKITASYPNAREPSSVVKCPVTYHHSVSRSCGASSRGNCTGCGSLRGGGGVALTIGAPATAGGFAKIGPLHALTVKNANTSAITFIIGCAPPLPLHWQCDRRVGVASTSATTSSNHRRGASLRGLRGREQLWRQAPPQWQHQRRAL